MGKASSQLQRNPEASYSTPQRHGCCSGFPSTPLASSRSDHASTRTILPAVY